MKIFITGGTGFIGSKLARLFNESGHQVTVLSRYSLPGPDYSGMRVVHGDTSKPGNWQKILAEHDAVINLAGASIFSRWSDETKRFIYNSRIMTTRNVIQAVVGSRVRVLISGSAAGYYGYSDDKELDESASPGNDFLATVARDWEHEALRAEHLGVRVVILRFGVVFGKNGGALSQLVKNVNRGLGCHLASGQQWLSWIHEKDLQKIFLNALSESSMNGIYNCTAPNPVTNRELMKTIRAVLDKKAYLPAPPAWVLRLVLGEFGNFLANGQRVKPSELQKNGFEFEFPDIQTALRDLL